MLVAKGFSNEEVKSRLDTLLHRGKGEPVLLLADSQLLIGVVPEVVVGTEKDYYNVVTDDRFIVAYVGTLEATIKFGNSILDILHVEGVDALLKKIDSSFAIAIYDIGTKTTYVARDYLGIEPLYYYRESNLFYNRFMVASEIKSFYGLPLKEVRLFPHGHYLKINNESFEFIRYTSIKTDLLEDGKDEFFIKEVRDRLEYAVEKQLSTDLGEVCVMLSGGVDSTVIAAIAKQLKPDIKAFTFSVGDKGKADLYYARLAAEYLNIELVEVIVTPKDVLDNLEEIIYLNEDKSWTQISSAVGQYFLAKEMEKQGYRVALGGEVSDEIFATYPQIKRFKWRDEQYVEARRDLISKVGSNNLSRSNKVMLGAGTISVRNPMADRVFLEFAGNVPARFKSLKVGTRKQDKPLLRLAFEDIMPKEVVNRDKGCQGTVTWVDEILEPLKQDIKNIYNKLFNDRGKIVGIVEGEKNE